MFKSFKLNKRELKLLILCCIIIITTICYLIVIEPFFTRNESLKEGIQERKRKFLKLQRTILLKEPIELSYLEILPRLSQVGSDEEKKSLFLKEIELASKRSSLYITSLKPISILEKDNFKEYLLRVEAEGTLHSLAKFLYNLPESGQVVSLRQLQISRLSQQEGLLQFQMNLGRMVIDTKDEE